MNYMWIFITLAAVILRVYVPYTMPYPRKI